MKIPQTRKIKYQVNYKSQNNIKECLLKDHFISSTLFQLNIHSSKIWFSNFFKKIELLNLIICYSFISNQIITPLKLKEDNFWFMKLAFQILGIKNFYESTEIKVEFFITPNPDPKDQGDQIEIRLENQTIYERESSC